MPVLAAIVTFGLFYKIGELIDQDRIGTPTAYWLAALSAASWAVTCVFLGWSWFAGLAVQAALLVVLFACSFVTSLFGGSYHGVR